MRFSRLLGGADRSEGFGFLRWLPFIVIAVLGVVTAVLAYLLGAATDDARVRGELAIRAEWRADDFNRKLNDFVVPIEAMVAFVTVHEPLDAALFQRFAEAAHRPEEPLRRLIWAPRTGAEGDEHMTVAIDERFRSSTPIIGFDLAVEPFRRAAIEQARDLGRPVSTSPFRLSRTGVLGYVVFWPVYRTGVVPDTVAARRTQLRGVVEGSFGVEEALRAAIKDTPRIIESIGFFAAEPATGMEPVAAYSPDSDRLAEGGTPLPTPAPGGIRFTHSFTVLGQNWHVVSEFDPAIVRDLRSGTVWIAPAAVLLLTAALLGYLARERGYRREVEARVAERTAALHATNDALAAEAAARQRTQEQLVQAQKMEAIGNLTGGMAHDFNNLLGIVIGNLDLLRDQQADDTEAAELSQDALDAALRGADLIRRLLTFARRQPLQPERININDLVTGIASLLRRTIGEQIEVVLELPADLWPVVVDPMQLQASIINIANNARDAMPDGGHLIIATGNRRLDVDYARQHPETAPGDYAMIEISDTGSGMSPEVASHIFEPFFTTKSLDKGTGLGLSMVYGFIKQSGGHVNVYSEIGIGTTFRLYLPRAELAEDTVAARPSEPVFAGQGETILVVEDNASLRRVVVRQLSELGYRVLAAENAEGAMRLLETERVDLLFSDIVMPGGTSGYELAQKAQARWPEIRVLLTSGFPDIRAKGDGRPIEARLLSKPYRRDDLAREIRQAFAGGPRDRPA